MTDFLSRKLEELNCRVKVSQHNIAFDEKEKCLVLCVQAAHEHIISRWNMYEINIFIKRNSKYIRTF